MNKIQNELNDLERTLSRWDIFYNNITERCLDSIYDYFMVYGSDAINKRQSEFDYVTGKFQLLRSEQIYIPNLFMNNEIIAPHAYIDIDDMNRIFLIFISEKFVGSRKIQYNLKNSYSVFSYFKNKRRFNSLVKDIGQYYIISNKINHKKIELK